MSNTPGVQSWKDVIRSKRKTHAGSCEQRRKTERKEAEKPSPRFLKSFCPELGMCLAPCDALTFLDSQPSSKAKPTPLPPIELWLLYHFQPHSDPKEAAQTILLRTGWKKGTERGSSDLPASLVRGYPKLIALHWNWISKEKGVCGPHGRGSVTCFGEGLPVVENCC